MREKLRSNLENPVERIRVIALLSISVTIIIIGTVFTVRNALRGDVFNSPLFLESVLVSVVFLVLLLLGYHKEASTLFFLAFAIFMILQFFTEDFYEYYTLFLAVIISGSFFFTGEKVAYGIMFASVLVFILLFVFKENPADYSPDMFFISIFSLILISIYTSLNIWVYKLYNRELAKNRDELEKEVKKRTKELEKARDYTAFLFQKSPIAIYTMDGKMRIVDMNEMAESITGYRTDELSGQPAIKLFLDESDPNPLFSSRNLKDNESIILSKKGEKKIIERYQQEVEPAMNRTIKYIESIIDLTSIKQLEIFKEDVEGIMRHDLKTPLNSVIGFSEILLRDETLSEESRECVQIVANSGKNMLNLVNHSLILYKIESGTYNPVFEPVCLLHLLNQVKEELNLQALDKECSIAIKTSEKSIMINSEYTLLYMIFSNLIKNAIEASPPGNTVTVSLVLNEKLIIEIHNKGAIPENIRDSFFDKYVTSSKKNGTGLGTFSAVLAASVIGADLNFRTDETEGTYLYLSIPSDYILGNSKEPLR